MYSSSKSVAGVWRGKWALRYGLAGLVLAIAGARVSAAPITVPNFSFELPAVADGTFAAATGWAESGSGAHEGGAYNPTAGNFLGAAGNGALPGTAQGAQAGLMHAGGTASSNLTTAASLATIQANTTYTLTVALGNALDSPAAGQSISQAVLTLLANGASAAQLGFDAKTIPLGTFTDYTVSFSTGATGPLIGQALTASIGHAADLDSAIIADNVRIDASPVPEPSTTALLLGTLVLTLGRRKRRK